MAIKFIVNFIAGLGYIKTENFLSKEWTRGEEILNLVSRKEIIESLKFKEKKWKILQRVKKLEWERNKSVKIENLVDLFWLKNMIK